LKQAKDIEKIFEEAFKDYEVDPGANAWNGIKNNLPQAEVASASTKATAASTAGSSSILTTAVVAVVISGVALGGYYLFDQKATNNKKVKTEKQDDTELVEAVENENKLEGKTKNEPTKTKVEVELKKDQAEQNTASSSNKRQHTTDKNQTTDKSSRFDTKPDAVSKNTVEKTEQTSSSINVEELINEIEVKEDPQAKELDQATTSAEPKKLAKSAAEQVNETANDDQIARNNGNFSDEKTDLTTPKIDMPNAFTPNGDGANDYFEIIDTEIDDLEVRIYSRTSRLVAQWKGRYGKWDGSLPDGTPAPEGVYYYQVNFFKDGKVFAPERNSVTLER